MGTVKAHNTRSLYFPERITKAMVEIMEFPLTIVEAPMGYGKTTAVREYVNNTDANVLWQRVHDSTTASFWNGFCNLLDKVDNARAENLIQFGFPNHSSSRQEAVEIIEDIEFPERTVLIIDDYHIIDCIEVNSFIELLIKNEIPNLHLILTLRYTTLENLDELKLKGYLNHIEKEIFEFTTKEIKSYYKLCGITLKDSDADKLYSLTEGWISALYLLLLNYLDGDGLSSIVNIQKLVGKTVYEPFSEEIKEFLKTLCIFDSFTFDQAAHMWEKVNTDSLLAEITNKNAFLKYDSVTKTYQIHNIFASYLNEKIENKSLKNDLYQRAAQWFLKVGDYRLSMHYFYLCNDFDNVYLVLEKEKASGKNVEHKKELLIKYLSECPEEIKARHHLGLLLIAFRLYSSNEIDLFRKTCGELIRNIQSDEMLNTDQRNCLLGEFELLVSFTLYNDMSKMVVHYKKAGELLSRPSSFLHSNGIYTFGSPCILYIFYRGIGRLKENLSDIEEAIPYYSKVTNGGATGAEYVMKAECFFYAGDYENAEITVQQALLKALSKNQYATAISAWFLQARIAFIKGDCIKVFEILQKMHEEIIKVREYLFTDTIEICEGYIYSLINQNDKIPKWLKSGDFSSNRLSFPLYPMLNIVYGRALLLDGEYLKLIGSSENFIRIASVFPNLLGQIHTYIYTAAANKQIFRQNEALTTLKQALDIAMPDKVYMPFVENCDYIKSLLEELHRQGSYRQDIEKILKMYQPYQKAVEQIKKVYSAEDRPVLAGREIEIAQLAAEGFSNKEIGERLFITQNTVKTQLKRVFEKLDINSRAILKQYFNEKS